MANTLFDNILSKRTSYTIGEPLWKLRLTDGEYQELKEHISNKIEHNCYNKNIRAAITKLSIDREAALYYAEWYRREYNAGRPNKKTIYQSIFSGNQGIINSYYYGENTPEEDFFQHALNGANKLKIEWLRTREIDSKFYSMLYQGGLPINKIIKEKSSTNIIKYLVRGVSLSKIDQVGKLAHLSQSMNDFADELCKAIDENDMNLLPFLGNVTLLNRLRNIYTIALNELKFRVNWYIMIDEAAHRNPNNSDNDIKMGAFVKSPSNLNNNNNVQYDIESNNNNEGCFYYQNGILINNIREITNITGISPIIRLLEGDDIVYEDSVNMGVPRIYKKEISSRGVEYYKMCPLREMCYCDTIIMVPKDWTNTVSGDDNKKIIVSNSNYYKYSDREYYIIDIPKGNYNNLKIELCDGCNIFEFSNSSNLKWLEIEGIRNRNRYLLSEVKLFNPNIVNFNVTDDLGTTPITKTTYIQYHLENDKLGVSHPIVHGRISHFGKMSMKYLRNNDFTTDTPYFYYLGDENSFDIKEDLGINKTTVRVRWNNGSVKCSSASKTNSIDINGFIGFEIAQLANEKEREIEIEMTPTGTNLQPFTLRIRVLFACFTINENGREIDFRKEGFIYDKLLAGDYTWRSQDTPFIIEENDYAAGGGVKMGNLKDVGNIQAVGYWFDYNVNRNIFPLPITIGGTDETLNIIKNAPFVLSIVKQDYNTSVLVNNNQPSYVHQQYKGKLYIARTISDNTIKEYELPKDVATGEFIIPESLENGVYYIYGDEPYMLESKQYVINGEDYNEENNKVIYSQEYDINSMYWNNWIFWFDKMSKGMINFTEFEKIMDLEDDSNLENLVRGLYKLYITNNRNIVNIKLTALYDLYKDKKDKLEEAIKKSITLDWINVSQEDLNRWKYINFINETDDDIRRRYEEESIENFIDYLRTQNIL